MKLQQLNEMAAKKICPDCGKSMAGHHYWYKGGWRCKKTNIEVATNIRKADIEAANEANRKYQLEKEAVDKAAAKAREDDVRSGPASISQVQVGDYVCFKYDIEQGSRVLKVTRDAYGNKIFTVRASQGEYVSDHEDGDVIQVRSKDCWIE